MPTLDEALSRLESEVQPPLQYEDTFVGPKPPNSLDSKLAQAEVEVPELPHVKARRYKQVVDQGVKQRMSEPDEFKNAAMFAEDPVGFVSNRWDKFAGEVAQGSQALEHGIDALKQGIFDAVGRAPKPYRDPNVPLTESEQQYVDYGKHGLPGEALQVGADVARFGADYGLGIAGFFAGLPGKVIHPKSYAPEGSTTPAMDVLKQEGQGLRQMAGDAIAGVDYALRNRLRGGAGDPSKQVNPNNAIERGLAAIMGVDQYGPEQYKESINRIYDSPASPLFAYQIGKGAGRFVKNRFVKTQPTIQQQSVGASADFRRMAGESWVEEKVYKLDKAMDVRDAVKQTNVKFKRSEGRGAEKRYVFNDPISGQEFSVRNLEELRDQVAEVRGNGPKMGRKPELEETKIKGVFRDTRTGDMVSNERGDLSTAVKRQRDFLRGRAGGALTLAVAGLGAAAAYKSLSDDDPDRAAVRRSMSEEVAKATQLSFAFIRLRKARKLKEVGVETPGETTKSTPMFYSRTEQLLDKIIPTKGDPRAVLKQAKEKGLIEELQDAGVDKFLEDYAGSSITKKEILEKLHEGRPQVFQVLLTEDAAAVPEHLNKQKPKPKLEKPQRPPENEADKAWNERRKHLIEENRHAAKQDEYIPANLNYTDLDINHDSGAIARRAFNKATWGMPDDGYNYMASASDLRNFVAQVFKGKIETERAVFETMQRYAPDTYRKLMAYMSHETLKRQAAKERQRLDWDLEDLSEKGIVPYAPVRKGRAKPEPIDWGGTKATMDEPVVAPKKAEYGGWTFPNGKKYREWLIRLREPLKRKESTDALAQHFPTEVLSKFTRSQIELTADGKFQVTGPSGEVSVWETRERANKHAFTRDTQAASRELKQWLLGRVSAALPKNRDLTFATERKIEWVVDQYLRQLTSERSEAGSLYVPPHFADDASRGMFAHYRTNERLTNKDGGSGGDITTFIEEIQSDFFQNQQNANWDAATNTAKRFSLYDTRLRDLLDRLNQDKRRIDLEIRQRTSEVSVRDRFNYGKNGPAWYRRFEAAKDMHPNVKKEKAIKTFLRRAEKLPSTAKWKAKHEINRDRISNLYEMQHNLNEAVEALENMGPNLRQIMPFGKSYISLALKAALYTAAKEGHKYVAWTNGRQQAMRWNAGNYLNKLSWKREEGGIEFYAEQAGGNRGFSVTSRKQLAEYVGKDIADMIWSEKGGIAPRGELTAAEMVEPMFAGGDNAVGGKTGQYDKATVKAAEKLLKEYGGKVEQGYLENAAAERPRGNKIEPGSLAAKGYHEPVWRIEITDKMREAILGKGLPLYGLLAAGGYAAWQKLSDEQRKEAIASIGLPLLSTFGIKLRDREGRGGRGIELTELTRKRTAEIGLGEIPKKPWITEKMAQAVINTKGASWVEEGLKVPLMRNQKFHQAGSPSVRGGVFYALDKKAARFYTPRTKGPAAGKPIALWYGGNMKVKGEAILRNPLFVKAQVGGLGAVRAYDIIKGAGAHKALRQEIVDAGLFSMRDSFRLDALYKIGRKYGIERDLLDHIWVNSREGNQLNTALFEHIVGIAVRDAGHDAVLTYTVDRRGNPVLAELFDVHARSKNYPDTDFVNLYTLAGAGLAGAALLGSDKDKDDLAQAALGGMSIGGRMRKAREKARARLVALRSSTIPTQTAAGAGEAVSREQIVSHWGKLGVPLAKKGFVNQRKFGAFDQKTEAIQARDTRDIFAVSSGVADYLTTKRGQLLQGVAGLEDLGKKIFPDSQPKEGYYKAGLVEATSRWLQGEDITAQFPDLAGRLNQLLQDAELGPQLSEGRRLTSQWYQQGSYNRVWSQMDRGPVRRLIARGLGEVKEDIKRLTLLARTYWTDAGAPIESFERQARGVSKITPETVEPRLSPTQVYTDTRLAATSKARSMVLDGVFDFAGNKTYDSLREVLRPIAGSVKRQKDFMVYMMARRALDLHARDIDPGISKVDAEVNVRNLETPEFKETARRLTEWQDRVLDYIVDAGTLSAEQAEAIRVLNPVYVPFKRAFDTYGGLLGGQGNYANVPRGIQRIKGSKRPIIMPLESIIKQTADLIGIGDRVRVTRLLADLADQTPERSNLWMRKIDPPGKMADFDLQTLKTQLEAAGVDLTDADLGQVVSVFSHSDKSALPPNVVSVWRDGKRQYYEVDPILYRSLSALNQGELWPAMRILFQPFAKAVRLGATGLNPEFALATNPMRDIAHYMVTNNYVDGGPAGAAAAWFRGLYRTVRPNDYKLMAQRSGADMSMFLGTDRKQIQRAVSEVLLDGNLRKSLNVVQHPIVALRELLSFTESAPRLAELESAYKKTFAKYGNKESARIAGANAYSDVTVNFRRAGIAGQALNSMIAFFNATIQGQSKFYRTIRDNPKRTFVRSVAYVTAPTLALWYINKDEQWYKEMPSWLKYGFWHIRVGTNDDGSPKVVRIPRPFEFGIAFGSVPEAIADWRYRNDPEGVNQVMKMWADNLVPDVMPSSLKPMLETYYNKNAFTDDYIVPQYYEDKFEYAPEKQYFQDTPMAWRWLGNQIGYSPLKIKHLAEGYTGGLVKLPAKLWMEKQGQAAYYPVFGRYFDQMMTPAERLERITYHRDAEKLKLKGLIEAGGTTEAAVRIRRWNLKYPDPDLQLPAIEALTAEVTKALDKKTRKATTSTGGTK